MRRLVPALVVSALAIAACGGGDDDATSDSATSDSAAGTSAVPSSAAATTTTIDPAECFDVPAAATPTTTTPPTTAAPVVGPTLPPATSAPATTVPPTTVPDTTPGTATPGVDPAAYPADTQPQAIRPCEQPPVLQITVLRPGTGHKAVAGDKLYMDYIGIRSADGAVFDESYSRGLPLDFTLGQGGVIPGWDQGLLGAQQGALIRLDIPADLAYGDQPPTGDVIQAGDALTFITEVEMVLPATTAADAPLDVTVPKSVGATEVTTQDVIAGTGPELQTGQTAIVHAMLVRGDNLVVLTDTWATNTPAEIALVEGSASLPGLVEGLAGAKVGTRRIITMPPADAYGPQGAPSLGLPAGTDLIAVVEVIGVLGEPSAG